MKKRDFSSVSDSLAFGPSACGACGNSAVYALRMSTQHTVISKLKAPICKRTLPVISLTMLPAPATHDVLR